MPNQEFLVFQAGAYGIANAPEIAQINTDRSIYSQTGSIQTYVPYLGMILKGDHSNSPFNMDEPNLYYAIPLGQKGEIAHLMLLANPGN